MEESKIMFEGKIFSKLKNPMHDWDYPIPHDVFENDKNVFEKLLTTLLNYQDRMLSLSRYGH